ncbi:hypothetical protein BN1356_02315 [Streptococcus varani]|uniref:Uncharacterized protein n=1 Tax=Streptococcus varani TaxID=1608583 RepID=A0A0E4H5R9_9STRE|nr:hypothetical protein BN1356_02315 [Streptococcus varani]
MLKYMVIDKLRDLFGLNSPSRLVIEGLVEAYEREETNQAK